MRHGGEVLAAGDVDALKADPKAPQVVLMNFSSEKAFHDDPEYQPFKTLRQNETASNGSIVGVAAYEG